MPHWFAPKIKEQTDSGNAQKSQIVEYKMLTQIYKSLKRICSDYALTNLYTPLHAR